MRIEGSEEGFKRKRLGEGKRGKNEVRETERGEKGKKGRMKRGREGEKMNTYQRGFLQHPGTVSSSDMGMSKGFSVH